MKTINNYIIEKLVYHQQVDEKLIITKDTKEKRNNFYDFTESLEANKILSICGFNNTNHKPSKKEINTLEAVLYDLGEETDPKLMENKTYYALLDEQMYNILDNKYGISQYKDYIEIDNDKFDKLFYNRYDRYIRYSIAPDYFIHKYYQSTNILYYDTRNPDDEIYIFFIMK